MRRIIGLIAIPLLLVTLNNAGSSRSTKVQLFPKNECVRCHSRTSLAEEITGRFLEWRASSHATAGVACNQCHGGDSRQITNDKAHAGVFPPADTRSRLHEQNAPETCGSCHKAVQNSFTESEHYKKLKETGLGPSCVNCHAHMGSFAARSASEGESLCTFCHNSMNGLLPQRPDIVRKAKSTLDAIQRTRLMAGWIDELIQQAAAKGLNVNVEKEDLRLIRMTIAEAKTGWHAFVLDGPLNKAGKSFNDSVKLKDRLEQRLGNR